MTRELDERLYTPYEIRDKLDVHLNSVYAWLHTGKLRGLRAGCTWRVRESDLEKFLNTKVH